MTNIEDLLAGARDTLTASRVFGEPYEKDGVTIIPAAAVRGGGGGGEGESTDDEAETPAGSGSGGGFGMSARPVGAYVVRGDDVAWVPAADTTRVLIFAQVLGMVALWVVRSVLKARAVRKPTGR